MHVELASISPVFLGAVQEQASHFAIGATSNVPHPYPADGAFRWYERVAVLAAAGKCDVNVILVEGEFAGVVSLNSIDRNLSDAHVDYWVAVPFQGRGVAKRAVRECIGRAEGALAISVLHSGCLADNWASAAVLLHNGFVEGQGTLLASGKFAGRQYRTFKRRSPNPSIERTVSSGLRPLPTAAHVKR